MFTSEVPYVGERIHVDELGLDFTAHLAVDDPRHNCGGCFGCAGHGMPSVCQALPDCSTRSRSIIFKEISWPKKPS